jgi:FkbM family methyltransferase|tara:strand:- start:15433 stop:16149 length:717 start_codon:yes stop_codon:yes gene_type:complete
MNPNCTISEKCFVVGLYDKDLMLFLKEFIGHDDLFFDVGANVGPFSLICSDAGAKVVAFEGHPKTGSILRDNFSLNNINPELVVNVAISSESGFVKFLDDPGSAVNSVVERDSNLSELSVKSVKLDDMADLFGCPSYVKIDTEGHEFSVFKGMKKILGHCKPKLISFEANGLSSLKELQGIHDLLSANGYLVGNIDYKSREFVISKCLGGKSAVGDYHACSKSFIDLILKESFLIKES